MCVIFAREEYNQSAIKLFFFFLQRFLLVSRSFCQSQGTVVTMQDVSAFLDMGDIRIGLIKSAPETKTA